MIPFLRVTNVNKLVALTTGPAAPSPAVSRLPLSLFSSQRRLLPLRVTPTHFTLTFYDQILRLPTSVHISGLAILKAKSRLSCFLGEFLHPLIRSYFLLLPPGSSLPSFLHSPRWNPSSFSVELILSYRCSCFDPPFSRHLLFLLLSDSRSVLGMLSCHPFFLLSHTRWHIWQKLSFLSFSSTTRLQLVARHSFLPGNSTTNKLAKRRVLLQLSIVPCSLSTLAARIRSSFFSRWGSTISP